MCGLRIRCLLFLYVSYAAAWYTRSMKTRDDILLRTLFIYIWVLALAHMMAQRLHLYWTYRWLDVPMHFLGGVWVGLAALWLWYYSGWGRRPGAVQHRPFLVALGGGLAFGLLWECFDFLVWSLVVGSFPQNYLADSVLDITMDVLGACVAYMVFYILSSPLRASRESS